jgi:hypothetical protein
MTKRESSLLDSAVLHHYNPAALGLIEVVFWFWRGFKSDADD